MNLTKNQKLGKTLYYLTWPGIWLMIKLQPPRTRVFILSGGKILLAQDWLGNGNWSLPGGGLHRNEDSKLGAIREVKEETGIIIDPSKLKFVGTYKYRSSGTKITAHTYYINLPKLVKPIFNSAEIFDCQWFEINDLYKIRLSGSVKYLLQALRQKTNLLK